MAGLGCGLAIGCGDDPPQEKGQLMVVIKTDMQVPKDVSAVRIEVLAAGVIRHRDTYELGPDASHLKLPGTLAIIAGDDPSIPVKIRVLAFRGGEPKVLRETITTVPPDRIASLPMPISWLCWDEPNPLPPPEGQNLADAETSCQPGNTCAAGSCVAAEIESSRLVDYTPENVFGGGSGPGAVGSCFDTLGCFDQGVLVPVDLASCSLDPPSGGMDALNVALMLQPGGPGICNGTTCLVPLDQDAAEGWTIAGSGRINLPPAVCDQILNGAVLGVATSSSCSTKTPAIPSCGPWSSVTSKSGTFDGGAQFDAPDPCLMGPDGAHCGSVLGADPNTLYVCVNHATQTSTPCSAGCLETAGDDECTASSGFGGPCTTSPECGPGHICLDATSGAFDGESPAHGLCTVECTGDPKICDNLPIAAPCVEMGTRDFCLESCTIGTPASSKCGVREDMACAPVTLAASGTAAVTCVPICGTDADCAAGQRCNFATGRCTAAPVVGTQPTIAVCAAGDAGADDCISGLCQQFKDTASGAIIDACSGKCRLGSATGCGWDGTPVVGDAGAKVTACTMPGAPGAIDGDLGLCSELCNNACDCSNPSFACKLFNNPALEQKFGTLGYCAPYWEVGGGC